MVIGGCGGGRGPLHGDHDAMPNADALPAIDSARPDQPRADGGSDAGMDSPCYAPADCPAGLTCCLVFAPNGSSGEVSCQATCVPGDGMSYRACVTDADCPPAVPKCTFLASTNRGDFSICE